jgi:hypothetical protein
MQENGTSFRPCKHGWRLANKHATRATCHEDLCLIMFGIFDHVLVHSVRLDHGLETASSRSRQTLGAKLQSCQQLFLENSQKNPCHRALLE